MSIVAERPFATLRARREVGKALRKKASRGSHAAWEAPKDRVDPVSILLASDEGRVGSLVPIRHARMSDSPFAFYRGAAAIMASDLSSTPTTGFHVQICGDCHLMNFGGFATPERRFVFDINDFDETLPGPWEWDIKRLAVSFVIAGQSLGLKRSACVEAARSAVRSYREKSAQFAEMPWVQIWYERIDANQVFDVGPKGAGARGVGGRIRLRPGGAHLTEKMIATIEEQTCFVERPPLIYRESEAEGFTAHIEDYFAQYRHSVQADRHFLLDRYRVVDTAVKVVGVGSVGTRCAIVLLRGGETDFLILQFKEARASVLEPFVKPSVYGNHGQRVVEGQRLMQSASDLFLGWCHAKHAGFDFYFRQLRDMKSSVTLEGADAGWLREYAALCGWALARAHARAGDAAVVSGYLDESENFDDAICHFAEAYAEQNQRDYQSFVKAIADGRVALPKPST